MYKVHEKQKIQMLFLSSHVYNVSLVLKQDFQDSVFSGLCCCFDFVMANTALVTDGGLPSLPVEFFMD